MTEALPGATWHRGVDLIAVERVLRGVLPLPELTEDEQRYAVLAMTEADLSASVIADRLGIATRTVTRYRADAGVTDDRP